MGHTKANPSIFSCLDVALPDEPYFELLARDPSFGKLVRAWADEREAAIRAGDRPIEDTAKVDQARSCAIEGETWRRDNLYSWRGKMTGRLDHEAFLASIPEAPAMVAACEAWDEMEQRRMTDYRTMSGSEFQREAGDDVDKWADAAMIAAEDLGYKLDRDWLRSLLADAMDAARQLSVRTVIK